MNKFKKFTAIAALTATVTLGTGCTPEQILTYGSLVKSPSADCYQAVDKHFSGDKNRMKKIVRRESGNNPSAANKSSSASSCAQLLFSLHGWRYEAVGCSKTQRYDADCNIKAADHLYREQGWRPWKLTDY